MANTLLSSPTPCHPLPPDTVIVDSTFGLADAATIAVDVSHGGIATVTLAGNRTLGNPTGSPVGGQKLLLIVAQDGTGGRTLAFGTQYDFTGLSTPVLNAAASAKTIIEFVFDAASTKWRCVSSTAANNNPSSVVSGTLTVADGATTGTAAVANANGKPVVATVQVQGATPRFVLTAVIAAGTLTVTLSGDPGAGGATVSYVVDKR